MDKKYQVFISSTFRDLIEERQDAIRSVLDLGHVPSGMEVFPAADVEQFEYIKKVVDECDYYVLIVGGRYGSVDAAGISFTEKEYDYAVAKKKVVLAFLHGDVGSIPVAKSDTTPAVVESLNQFRSKVSKGRLVQFWQSREDLKAKVIISLSKAMSESPGIGWIRGDAAASEALYEQLNALQKRYDEASAEVKRLQALDVADTQGLADFDAPFNIRFSYSEYSSYSKAFETRRRTVALTWRQIFSAIGPYLIRPCGAGMIASCLVKYLKENSDVVPKDFTIYDSDENTIKFQLIAYGLVKAYAAEAKGGGVSEFIDLTERGSKQLIEIMAVRQ